MCNQEGYVELARGARARYELRWMTVIRKACDAINDVQADNAKYLQS